MVPLWHHEIKKTKWLENLLLKTFEEQSVPNRKTNIEKERVGQSYSSAS